MRSRDCTRRRSRTWLRSSSVERSATRRGCGGRAAGGAATGAPWRGRRATGRCGCRAPRSQATCRGYRPGRGGVAWESPGGYPVIHKASGHSARSNPGRLAFRASDFTSALLRPVRSKEIARKFQGGRVGFAEADPPNGGNSPGVAIARWRSRTSLAGLPRVEPAPSPSPRGGALSLISAQVPPRRGIPAFASRGAQLLI